MTFSTCSVTEPLQFEALVFNADNWFVAQEIVVNAIDDDIILESPYGSLLRVVDIGEMMDVNITLLVSEMDIGMCVYMHVVFHHLSLCIPPEIKTPSNEELNQDPLKHWCSALIRTPFLSIRASKVWVPL